jgi:hypothetical protein
MSHNRLTPTKTEIVHPGQPSVTSLAALKEIGGKVTDEQLAQCYAKVEAQRSRFVADVVRLGVMLLAKKQTLGHGKWEGWVIQMTKSAESALLTIPAVAQEKSIRSCQVYMQVGKHFLADLEQGHFQPEAPDAPVSMPTCTPLDIVLLPSLSEERQSSVEDAIAKFVGGRSLERMLIDFRRAENAADVEALEEDASRRRKPKSQRADPNQLEFLDEMYRPLSQIDTLFESTTFKKMTDRKFWETVADKLEAQAVRARKLAKESRG